MTTPPRQENVGRSRTRRLTDIFFTPSSSAPSTRVGGAVRGNSDGIVDRAVLWDELSNTPSPSSRLTSFPEVVEEVMEAERQPRPGPPDHSNDGSHQRLPLDSVQLEGGKVWKEFNRHSHALQKDLQKFQDAVQGLGSSLDLAQSVRRLRESLSLTTWLVGENTRKLFPHVVRHSDPPQIDSERDPEHDSEQRSRPPWPPLHASQSTGHRIIKSTPVHKELKKLAKAVKLLRDVLERFPEFEDIGKRTLRCFEGDVEYWSSCLEQYGDGTESREIQVYIHDLSQELGYRLNDIGECVGKYIACVPTVRISQEHTLSNLQTLATIATFFSAVTASTLQFSIANMDPGITAQVVNTLWFSSLVFSIASALNSSIAFMWRSAVYSSPHRPLRGWLWLWMRQSPAVFLLISVMSFLSGLGCFAVSSQPHHIWIVVIICECVSFFSVAALLVWLAADKWSFYRLQQQQRRSGFRFNQFFGGKPVNLLPTHVEHTASWSLGYLSRSLRALTSASARFQPLVPQTASWRVALKEKLCTVSTEAVEPRPSPGINREAELSPARQRWRRAIKSAILVSKAIQSEKYSKDIFETEHMTRLEDSLQTISVGKEVISHDAGPGTSGIQFDPEGRRLAICGKRLTLCYDVGPSQTDVLKLPHYIGLARQVIWTACGNHIVIRTHRAVHIWSMSANPNRKTDIRYETSGFILGIPKTKEYPTPRFISIEGSGTNKLAIIDVHGEEQRKPYEFENLSIQHVDIGTDGLYLLLAAEVSESPEGLRPMTASPARKLIVFNLIKFQVEHEVPLWHDVQHVTVSKDGRMAIITYRGGPPPQLWLLRLTMAGVRLSLERQFSPRNAEPSDGKQVQFVGKGHFLNKDRFILCTSTLGNIYIWRRDRPEPVHILDQLTKDEVNDRPVEVACNPASDDFMFATRSQDGSVRIWTVPEAPPRELHASGSTDNMLGLHSTDGPLQESPVLEPVDLPPES